MEKVINIVSKDKEEEADIEFWKNKTPQEKLDGVQYLRELWIEKFQNQEIYNESRKGLRRFYKVVKQKQR